MGKIAKAVLAGVLCNIYRLIRIIPNNDPIMGAMLPFSRQNPWVSGAFAALTMASFDLLTGSLGIWTIVTSLTYGFLGVAFGFAYKGMKNKKPNLLTYLASGAIGVLFFDFITGPIASGFFFGMPFWQALVGQVPFTILHLLSVSFFILLLTPLIDRTIVENESLEDRKVLEALSFKAKA